jgi:hypothetical protein
MSRREKTLTGDPAFGCPVCRTTWTPILGRYWLVKKESGALAQIRLEKDEDGELILLSRCPECGALQSPKGKARVEEVKE